MNQHTHEDFEEIRKRGEELYKSFEETYCPYFKEKIIFNADGIEHLRFKSRGRLRSEQDQYMRFKLLHLIPSVLSHSHTLQGMLETKEFERVRIHSRTEYVLKPVTYYEFISLMGRNRIKVIIKQIGNGQKFFWSIIPFWRMNSKTFARILHEGDLKDD